MRRVYCCGADTVDFRPTIWRDTYMRTETEHTIFLKDYAPSPYRIVSVDLDFNIGAETTRVRAQLTVESPDGQWPVFAEEGH